MYRANVRRQGQEEPPLVKQVTQTIILLMHEHGDFAGVARCFPLVFFCLSPFTVINVLELIVKT